jgi:flagellar hook-basal body complex protein FliE
MFVWNYNNLIEKKKQNKTNYNNQFKFNKILKDKITEINKIIENFEKKNEMLPCPYK